MIIKKFEEQAAKFAKKIAIETDDRTVTFHELNTYANRLAHRLIKNSVKGHQHQIAALLFEHSVDMITGLLAALKADHIYVPMDATYPENRLTTMLEHSEARVILTDSKNLALAKTLAAKLKGNHRDLKIININTLDNDLSIENIPRNPSDDNPAYILYTSGTTGKSRGVLQSHGNILYYIRSWTAQFSISPVDRITLFASFSHDGSIPDIYSALLNGAVLYPKNIKEEVNTSDLPKWIIDKKITIWHSVPTLYRYFVHTLRNQEDNYNYFPGLRFIVLGGEPVIEHDVSMFKRFFPNTILANIYGQTESTVNSFWMVKPGSEFDRILIGDPIDRTELLIIDENGGVVEDFGIGEIFVASKHIALGYWKDTENSEKVFLHDPDIGRLYRTGDFGKLISTGKIEFLGRNDTQVKIRGFRVELGEIETALLTHESIKETAVIDKQKQDGETYLCAYIVLAGIEDTIDTMELRVYLSRFLPDYMVPALFMLLEKMPLTPSNKIDRNALPDPGALEDQYIAPRNPVERKLAEIWAEVLGNQSPSSIGIDDNYFELGGHSLRATLIVSKILKELNVNVPLADILGSPTIRGLEQIIKELKEEQYPTLEPVEQKEYYSLSSAQKRIFVLHQMEQQSISYNLPIVWQLQGNLDKEKLEQTFNQLLERHESLRTSFMMIEEEPVQKIHDQVEVKVKVEVPFGQINAFGEEEIRRTDQYPGNPDPDSLNLRTKCCIKNFIRPFDLSKAPLLRVGLIELPHTPAAASPASPTAHQRENLDNRYLLMIDMYHIISDATSLGNMQKEFMSLYKGNPLPGLSVQYKDYAEWQNSNWVKQSERNKKQEKYWLDCFASQGEIPVLHLPTDFPRPALQSFEGNSLTFQLNGEETKILKALAFQENATLYMVLLAICNIFFSKLSGQKDIVIGTPVSGRSHADTHSIIGMFVNTLAMRNFPKGEKTFKEFLGEVKENALAAFDNQDYPFEDLVEILEVNRDMSRNPLFDVMFELQNVEMHMVQIPGLKSMLYEFDYGMSKFDLVFQSLEIEDNVIFTARYCTKLFKPETIQRYINYFRELVYSITTNPHQQIFQVEMIPGGEKRRLLFEFNNTRTDYPKNKTVHQIFAEQVERIPDHVALVGIHQTHEKHQKKHNISHLSYMSYISYKELNQKSNQFAYVLKEKCITPDTVVAIMVERSIEMIIGILGILKAGGAYLPIDPDYPVERSMYMLADSGANVLVTTRALVEGEKIENRNNIESVFIDSSNLLPFHPSTLPSSHLNLLPVPATSLAYIIFTSGTTGTPKGVMVEHRSLVNYIHWAQKVYLTDEIRRIPLYSSLAFDLTVTSIFVPLISGITIVIYRDTGEEPVITTVFKDNNVEIVKLTPTHLKIAKDLELNRSSVRRLILGGEALTTGLAAEIHKKFHRLENPIDIFNEYGPTETVVGCMIYKYNFEKNNRQTVPIGVPADNVRVYLLDRQRKLLPIGRVGEIYISGDSVARGYLNNPEQSAERFVVNPFVPGQRMYRSGDLARQLPDGIIEFLGRMDQQVKIRGFRIELGEIENHLLTHQEIKEAVVSAGTDKTGETYLCAYVVPGKEMHIPEIREHLSKQLPAYMIPAYFMQLEKIPLTANGKIDRKSLPSPGITSDEKYTAPRNEKEKKLVEIWKEVLAVEIDKISIDDIFFRLGGHSLKATILSAKIHKELNVDIPLAEVFKTPTIRGLSQYIANAEESKFIYIEPSEQKEYYPLSPAQKSIYIQQQKDKNNLGYNMSQVLVLIGELDKEKVEMVFRQLIQRHESFRTSFHVVENELVQRIHDEVLFKIEEKEKGTGKDFVIKDFIRPFALSRAPLLRVGLIKIEENRHIFIVDMHHTIYDGVSLGILLREFAALYQDETLAPLRLQTKDFVTWQNSTAGEKTITRQKAYWQKVFAQEPPGLNLPLDFDRPRLQSFKGDSLPLKINKKEIQLLKTMEPGENITTFMVLIALYYVLLFKLSGQEDIVIGTAVIGRRHIDLQQVIGMFVNTLALRNYPQSEKTFRTFLKEVKTSALQAFENQEYPFEELVKHVTGKRDIRRHPLFDAMFVMQNYEISLIKAMDLQVEPLEIKKDISHFDLMFLAAERDNFIQINIQYSTALFEKETIENLSQYYTEILTQVTENKDIKLADIKVTHKYITAEADPGISVEKQDQWLL